MRRGVGAVVLVMSLTACGGDDGGDVERATAEAPAPDAVNPDASVADTAAVADCDEVPFTGTISRVADGGHREVSITGADVVDAVAYRYLGDNYTVYVADHPIDRSVLERFDQGDYSTDSAMTAAEGGVLVSLFLFGDQVGPGAAIELGSDVPGPIVDAGGGAMANSLGAAGTLTVIGMSDDRVCFEIDYADDFQQVVGTVSAPIWPDR